MKNIIRGLKMALILSALFPAHSDAVDFNEAGRIARDFFVGKGVRSGCDENSARRMRASDAEAPYYVFNAAVEDAFVIVNGNDSGSRILGYSLDRRFESDDITPQLKEILDRMSRCAVPADAPQFRTSAKLMPTAEWGQEDPYNRACPELGGVRAPSGCVATAMAIAMKYHNWPPEGRGSHTNMFSRESDDFSGFVIDWNSLKNTGAELLESSRACSLVAELMKKIGCAANLQYTPFETLGYPNYLYPALFNHFKYKMPRYYLKADPYGYFEYTDEEWMAFMLAEIEASRPFIYSCLLDEETRVGHTFVVDGVDEQGMFHVNWGWDGMNNGYFNLWPLGADASRLTSHNIITGIEPDFEAAAEPDIAYIEPAATENCGWNVDYAHPLAWNGGAYVGYVTGITSPIDKNYTFAVAFVDKDMNVLCPACLESGFFHNSVGEIGSYEGSMGHFTVSANAPVGAVGTAVVYRLGDSDPWKIMKAYGGSQAFCPIDGSGSKYVEIDWDIPSDALMELQENCLGHELFDGLPEKVISNLVGALTIIEDCGTGAFYLNGKRQEYVDDDGNRLVIFPNRSRELRCDKIRIRYERDTQQKRKEPKDGMYYVLDDADGTAKLTFAPVGAPYLIERVNTLGAYVEDAGKQYRLTRIGDYAFRNDEKLKAVTVPASVQAIGMNALSAPNLSNVTFEAGSELKSMGKWAFYGAPLSAIEFPGMLEEIGEECFTYHSLMTVRIPKSVKKIGRRAFAVGKNNMNVYVRWDDPTGLDIDPDAFSSVSDPDGRKRYLWVPRGTRALYEAMAPWSLFERIYEYDVASIDDVEADSGDSYVEVYTTDGIKVYSGLRGDMDSARMQPGMYIETSGGKARKIVVVN